MINIKSIKNVLTFVFLIFGENAGELNPGDLYFLMVVQGFRNLNIQKTKFNFQLITFSIQKRYNILFCLAALSCA